MECKNNTLTLKELCIREILSNCNLDELTNKIKDLPKSLKLEIMKNVELAMIDVCTIVLPGSDPDDPQTITGPLCDNCSYRKEKRHGKLSERTRFVILKRHTKLEIFYPFREECDETCCMICKESAFIEPTSHYICGKDLL